MYWKLYITHWSSFCLWNVQYNAHTIFIFWHEDYSKTSDTCVFHDLDIFSKIRTTINQFIFQQSLQISRKITSLPGIIITSTLLGWKTQYYRLLFNCCRLIDRNKIYTHRIVGFVMLKTILQINLYKTDCPGRNCYSSFNHKTIGKFP